MQQRITAIEIQAHFHTNSVFPYGHDDQASVIHWQQASVGLKGEKFSGLGCFFFVVSQQHQHQHHPTNQLLLNPPPTTQTVYNSAGRQLAVKEIFLTNKQLGTPRVLM